MHNEPPVWYADHCNIALLLRYMRNEGELDIQIAIEIVERPWRWTEEYQRAEAWLKGEQTKEATR